MTETGLRYFLEYMQERKEAEKRKAEPKQAKSKPTRAIPASATPSPSAPVPPPPLPNEDYTGSCCFLYARYQPAESYQEVLLDVADLDAVTDYLWMMRIVASGRRHDLLRSNKRITLSRHLLDEPQDMVVDHINRNHLDHRRKNLRACTRGQNNVNSCRQKNGASQYRGVQRTKAGRWIVQCGRRGKRVYLGTFDSEIEAARVYNVWAKQEYGEFAYQNPI